MKIIYTGGHTTGLSPDAVQASINAVAWERYMRESQPGYLSARDEFFVKQQQANEMVYVWDEDSNVGAFEETDEQADISNSDTRIGNQKTARQKKYVKQIPISWEAFKTDMVGKRERIGQQIGDRAKLTQDKNTILETYGDAFAGTYNTTPDGDALASNSHTTLTGVNVDNLETGVLNADNLWTLVQSLANQKAQDGEAGSQVFEGVVVPFILYKTVKETMNSQLVPFSGENQVNLFDTDYGTVKIAASIFLGSTYNAATNANTSYSIISSNHMVTRRVLDGLNMDMIEPKYTANDTYVERARYAETRFFESWTGYAGSNGTV